MRTDHLLGRRCPSQLHRRRGGRDRYAAVGSPISVVWRRSAVGDVGGGAGCAAVRGATAPLTGFRGGFFWRTSKCPI